MRKITRFINLIIVYAITFLFSINGYSFEGSTHSRINEYISKTEMGDFSFSQYLTGSLGFSKGKDEDINVVKGTLLGY
jgi:hypothetical protein